MQIEINEAELQVLEMLFSFHADDEDAPFDHEVLALLAAKFRLQAAIVRALTADARFEQVITDCEYSSRWDWMMETDDRPVEAYLAKVEADQLMHERFAEVRKCARALDEAHSPPDAPDGHP